METLSIKEPSIKVKPTGKDEKRHDGWMDGGMNGRTQGPDFERESDQIVITCTFQVVLFNDGAGGSFSRTLSSEGMRES